MKWILYRAIMKLAHRFNWHYAPPIYPEHDTMLWCKWCGMRYVLPRNDAPGQIQQQESRLSGRGMAEEERAA